MSESSKYEAYKKKLQGICDENNLVFRFRCNVYPITLTIRPVNGFYEQLSILENAEENGYTSPDAAIVFAYNDGALTYKMSETFSISDALFSKIKNLYKNMHSLWLQFFFRDIIQTGALLEKSLPKIDDDDDDDANTADFDGEDFEEDPGADNEAADVEDEDGSTNPVEDNVAGVAESGDPDPLLGEAIRLVRETGNASASLLQRRLKIGYARASHIIDALEHDGIIGAYNGSSPREVLPFEEASGSKDNYPYDEGGESDDES